MEDKFKIGEIVHLKVTHEHKDGKKETGVIVFEYLGRGLNALLKLNLNDDYLTLSEDGNTVNYNLGYLMDFNEDAYRNDVNEYRAMTGRVIHTYDLSEDVLRNFIDFMDDDYVETFIDDWIEDANIPKKYHKKIKSGDSTVIAELMEKYKKIPKPLTEEEKEKIKKIREQANMRFGYIQDKNGTEIQVVYFGDGTDVNRIHPFTIIDNRLTLGSSGDVNHWLVTYGLELNEVRVIKEEEEENT